MSKKKNQPKKRIRYGQTIVTNDTVFEFISKENKHGWSLGLNADGANRIIYFTNVRFATKKDVLRAVRKDSVHFIPLVAKK